MYNLKIAFRNLRRNGIYSAINIGGLSIGMAAAMLILLWTFYHWSYDRFHEKKKQLYCVWSHNDYYNSFSSTPNALGPALLENYADISNMTRFDEVGSYLITREDQKVNMKTTLADPGFLTMFSFSLLQGDKHAALNEPYSIILTQNASKRLFGDENPIGENVVIQTRYEAMATEVTVTGVMADLPDNTCFRFDAMLPYLLFKNGEDWNNNNTVTYIELQPSANIAEINLTVRDIIKQHGNNESEIFLYPMDKWHLYSKVKNREAAGGFIEKVRLFDFIALLILLIACINFMNLSTARSANRSREVGVRKVIGARRKVLVKQFLGESLLMAVIASIFAIVIVYLCLPLFNILMGEQLKLAFNNIGVWIAFLVFVLFTGILAGSYPAFYLSSFLPVKVLKGVFKDNHSYVTPRKLLIVVQFSCAVVLIISTMVIHRQIQYAQDRNAGYEKDQLVYVPLNDQMNKNYELIRRELLGTGTALSATRTISAMTDMRNSSGSVKWKGQNPDERVTFNRYRVDAGWVKTTGVTILQGRDIDLYTYNTDSTAMLLNETAVRVMGFDDPIGQIISESGREWHIVGVVKDFVIESPYEPVKPMIVCGPTGRFDGVHIKLNGANRMVDNLAQAKQIFKTYNPDYPFDYRFVDENYALKFANEQHTGVLVTWFAGLAIFISCLGLFGLSAYMVENRRKEIGIRKVLGASVAGITSLLSREFLTLVSISFIVAIPIAWYIMNHWLSGYSYRTDMPWWLFLSVAVLTAGIVLLTIGLQTIKAATTNPVKSLKTE